jgi:predicted esterase
MRMVLDFAHAGRLVAALAVLGALVACGCEAETAAVVVDLPTSLDDVVVRRPPARFAKAPRIALLLHGSGSSPRRFTDMADAVASQGFMAIVVRGQRELGPGRYTWSTVEETHALFGRIVELAKRDLPVSAERPVLVGYSAGATQAVQLLAHYPEAYASAFAISPGPIGSDALPSASGSRPLAILVGSADGPSEKAVAGIEQTGARAREPFWVVHHPGAHQPPSDWRERVDDAMTWMTVKADS